MCTVETRLPWESSSGRCAKLGQELRVGGSAGGGRSASTVLAGVQHFHTRRLASTRGAARSCGAPTNSTASWGRCWAWEAVGVVAMWGTSGQRTVC